MHCLGKYLLDYCPADCWQYKRDIVRGPKYFFITGRWCAQGRFRFKKDNTYLAGEAGKYDVPDGYPDINETIQQWGVAASQLLRRFRPDLIPVLDQIPSTEKKFGDFPLFMAARGVARMHKDFNDVVAVLFLIKSGKNCGGGLEIGGSGIVFNWEVGDAIILDSSKLAHGTRKYLGDVSKRVVGIFILHRSMLKIYNITIPK